MLASDWKEFVKTRSSPLRRMPVVFTRLKARSYLMRICLVKKLAESLKLNSNEEGGGAKNSSHSDTENNDDTGEDDTGDNADELYKEWSDIPASAQLHFTAATRTVTKTSFIGSRTHPASATCKRCNVWPGIDLMGPFKAYYCMSGIKLDRCPDALTSS